MEEHRRIKFNRQNYLEILVMAADPIQPIVSGPHNPQSHIDADHYRLILSTLSHNDCHELWEFNNPMRRNMIQLFLEYGGRRYLSYLINPFCTTYGYLSVHHGINPLYSKISADVDRFDVLNYMSQYDGTSIGKLVSHSQEKIREYLVKGIYQ